ncbi:glycerol-3-phosphate acyltransferase [Trichlorobacter ammonificans]|uniref:Glycerol-3-phosphate acyltransferase n=1 Tax=Trichlorobacter ammonificans TaxID=2916410 RepID=A0ABM9D8A0_9BACT|nr:glycerol-3-phosphate acyltransferase [Trichlorobacter ammonificans]CAH2031377.1 Glycerol-3-phosphate acyltransferase 1 [Trichlorobacter ammonificans]
MIEAATVLMFAYGLGCFCSGYYLVRAAKGIDIRDTASGNVGSRNVGRLLGPGGFLLTLLGDAGKGMLAVWIAQVLRPDSLLPLAALLAVVAGHIRPVQLGFRGGKGFATLAGGMLVLNPVLFLGTLVLSLLFTGLRRGTTAAGLLALALSPVLLLLQRLYGNGQLRGVEMVPYLLLVVMVLHAHRANIRAALNGPPPGTSGLRRTES